MRQASAKAEATEHIRDFHRDTRLARLAQVPLMLNGLIALVIQGIQLPRSRFKAYDKLTGLLLEEQPRRREKAAYARASTIGRLSDANRERALARLAWESQDSPSSDVNNLEKTVAQNTLREFFAKHLHKDDGEALEIADELLGIGAETIGILVEKSPTEFGFLHRSLQEFLAAKHLSNLPLVQQKKIVRKRFTNPQWHDVFLCLCYLNTRAGEVDAIVRIVEDMELPDEMALLRQSFLAEVAFSDLNCSAGIAGRLAEKTMQTIETGVHERTRERLLDFALDGLQSDLLRSIVESRIRRWYPLRYYNREGFYKGIASWPKCNKTQSILWRGLFDEEVWNGRAAAESLAEVFGGDQIVRKHLFVLLLTPAESYLQARALHALCLGWGSDSRLKAILSDARLSTDSALQSVACIHRVKRNEHDIRDRAILMNLSKPRSTSSWYWKRDRTRALAAGWPHDQELKKEAIRSVLSRLYTRETVFDTRDAVMLLVEGFPQDDEVAELLALQFKEENVSANISELYTNCEPLIEAFAGHRYLSPAVDDWIERNFDGLIWEYQLCLVSRSTRAKRLLLKAKAGTDIITEHQAHWLLKGWGMEDEEAADALTKFANSDKAKDAPDLLPEILYDNERCKVRLLEILETAPAIKVPHVLNGLIKLGVNELDEDVIQSAMEKLSGVIHSDASRWGISTLIQHFPSNATVREIAADQLHRLGGALNAVARVYGSDIKTRRKILELCSSFPARLRLKIVDRLSRLGSEDEVAHVLLSQFDEDMDVNVKTAAAIGYARSLKQRGTVPSTKLKELREGLRVTGRDFQSRRQAAFSALLELDRLDIVLAVWAERDLRDLTYRRGTTANHQLAKHLTRHWDRVSNTFGEAFWEQVDWVPDGFPTEMAAFTEDRGLSDYIIDRLISSDQEGPPTQLLQLCASKWRGTRRLRDLCLNLVRGFHIGSWMQTAPGILAAEILAEQFANDSETYTTLESFLFQPSNKSALVVALGSGWPNSLGWEHLRQRVEMSSLLLPARFFVLAANAPSDEFLTKAGSLMETLRGDIWEFPRSCSRALAVRFANDEQVRELAVARLEAQPTSVEKINFPSLLLENLDQPERLRNWIRSEIELQCECNGLAEIALDLSTGTIRSVGHVLMEHLAA